MVRGSKSRRRRGRDDADTAVETGARLRYASWLGGETGKQLRLPTEAEYQLIRTATAGAPGAAASLEAARDDEAADDVVSKDSAAMREAGLNLNFAWGSPATADDGVRPFAAVAGNAWEYRRPCGNLTASQISPSKGTAPVVRTRENHRTQRYCEDWFAALPGFNVHHLYDDFSAPCMDGQHSLILGGSFASTGNEASAFSRFHFRSHFHNLIGFRVVEGEGEPELTSHDAAKPWADGWVPPTSARPRRNAPVSRPAASSPRVTSH